LATRSRATTNKSPVPLRGLPICQFASILKSLHAVQYVVGYVFSMISQKVGKLAKPIHTVDKCWQGFWQSGKSHKTSGESLASRSGGTYCYNSQPGSGIARLLRQQPFCRIHGTRCSLVPATKVCVTVSQLCHVLVQELLHPQAKRSAQAAAGPGLLDKK
jgi:hypothetical protein